MSFTSRKPLVGQRIATIAEIELDKCKYTTSQYITNGAVTLQTTITTSTTGNVTISGGNATSFTNANPYALIGAEVVKITVNSNTELNITARAQLGTTAAAHSTGAAVKLMHSGEADGTCYSFPQTCSSGDSYDANTKQIFRFPNTQLAHSQIFYTGFKSWSHTPVSVDPGKSIGRRARASVRIADSVDNDVYVPYPDRRTTRATLFSKILARNPNIEGRTLRVKTGFDPLNYDESNFITREYVIDDINLDKGVLVVNALDPLILTEDKKAKAPVASKGNLAVAITDASTTITYKDDIDLAYGSSGTVFVRIDAEVIECTVGTGKVLNIVTRAYAGTEKKDHDINATIQKCLSYTNIGVVDIVEDLLKNYTKIKTGLYDDYTSVKAATSSIQLSALITKPTPVKKLVNELVMNGDLNVYYDEEKQKIRIKRTIDDEAGKISLNEDLHIKQGSTSMDRMPQGQLTRFTSAWGPVDPTKLDDDEDFKIIFQAVNANLEIDKAKGEVNESETFYNRWLTSDSSHVTIGTGIVQRMIDRTEQVPEGARFIIDAESAFETQGAEMKPGAIFSLESSRVVNPDGSNRARNYQVLSMKDLGNMAFEIRARLFQGILSTTANFTVDANKEKYDLSTEYKPTTPGKYVVLIKQGVVIGSDSTGTPAFTTGAQNAGVSFKIIIQGSILGMGGAGGNSVGINHAGPTAEAAALPGLVGGDALNLTVPCELDVGAGALWAGGGGAGGNTSYIYNNEPNGGNGGSGGQGYGQSAGGTKGLALNSTTFEDDSGVDGATGGRSNPGSIAGKSGGEWGEQGDNGSSLAGINSGASGGLAGFAVKSNGNTVTVLSGDNNLNIRGRRS